MPNKTHSRGYPQCVIDFLFRPRLQLVIFYIVTIFSVMRARLPDATVILNTIYLPPIHTLTGLEYHSTWGLSDLQTNYNAELRRIAADHSNILVHDVASLVSYVGYRQWF